MLVGCIWEGKGTRSFDARLVAIETGESVAAAFAGMNVQGKATLSPSVIPFSKSVESLRDAATAIAHKVTTDPDVIPLQGQRLCIAKFQNINLQGDILTLIFQEVVTTAFIQTKRFKVVERAQLDVALKELRIEDTGLFNHDQEKQLGKMLGAGYMMVGSISGEKGVVSFDAQLVAVETGENVSAAFASASSRNEQEIARAKNAGVYFEKMESGGLLSGSQFTVSWQDSWSDRNVTSFCAGDIFGDGKPAIATISLTPGHEYYYETGEGLDANMKNVEFNVYAWEKGKYVPRYKRVLDHDNVYGAEGEPIHLTPLPIRLLPADGVPWPISLGSISHTNWYGSGWQLLQWDQTKHDFATIRSTGYAMYSEVDDWIVDTIQWSRRCYLTRIDAQ